ncbi:MAG: hypothetical protein GY781_06195 [Gammaproteobacteria bacterium]|nr:hypothetical protein [Gammaproteobacteria bacterium]
MTHPLFQDIYSLFEVISNLNHKIDVIDIFLTAEAMGKVILWINRCPELVAVWAFETKIPLNIF